MNRRQLLTGVGGVAALNWSGCKGPDPLDSSSPQVTATPIEMGRLQNLFDQVLGSHAWIPEASVFPSELKKLQDALLEEGMGSTAEAVAILGNSVLPGMLTGMTQLDSEDGEEVGQAIRAGLAEGVDGVKALKAQLSGMRAELGAKGLLGDNDTGQLLQEMKDKQLEFRKMLHENELQEHPLATLGLAVGKDRQNWVETGADGEEAMQSLETGIEGLLDLLAANPVTPSGPPPPLADWAEDICDSVGVPGWFDWVFGDLMGLPVTGSCDEQRMLYETGALSALILSGMMGLITILFKQTALFGLITVAGGWFAILLLVVLFLVGAFMVLCRIDTIIDLWAACLSFPGMK